MLADVKLQLKTRFPRAWNVARTTNLLRQLIPRVYGFEARHCPICRFHGRFLAEIHFPDIFVYDAICPRCGSNTRNRLLKLAIEKHALLTQSTRLLHFAPELLTSGLFALIAAFFGASEFGLDPIIAVMIAALGWYGAEAALAWAAGWRLGPASVLAWLARDLALPWLWTQAWTSDNFTWRGNAMSVAEDEGGVAARR